MDVTGKKKRATEDMPPSPHHLLEPLSVAYSGIDRITCQFRTDTGGTMTVELSPLMLIKTINLSVQALNEYPHRALKDL